MANDFAPGDREAAWEVVQAHAKRDPMYSAALSKVAKAKIAMAEGMAVLEKQNLGFTTGSGVSQISGVVSPKLLQDIIENNPEFLQKFGAGREL